MFSRNDFVILSTFRHLDPVVAINVMLSDSYYFHFCPALGVQRFTAGCPAVSGYRVVILRKRPLKFEESEYAGGSSS